jgi:dihydroorotase
VFESDIYVRGGRIEKIGKDLSAMKVRHVLDVKGKFLLPGLIDDHVHFREPGLEYKGDFSSESRAAVAGGITTFFDMPDTIPNVLNSEILGAKAELAAEKSLANYAFYHGASNNNLEEIKAIDTSSCCGLKVYMGGSSGDMLVDRPEILDDVFKHSPVIIATHCEDTPTIVENEESFRQIYGDDVPFQLHAKIRSEEACYKSSSLAIELAKAHEARLHVLHVTTAKEAEMFADSPLADKLISAEVCGHYLTFSDEDYATKGSLIKCDPAIKTEVDRAGLFQGLMDNRLDVIGTDHSPQTWDEKQGNYFEAASGLPTAEFALQSLLEHHQDGILTLEFLVEKTSHAVADLFKLKDRGYIREGYWADFVIIDLEKGTNASNKQVLSKAAWTPYDGFEFRSSVYATVVNGDLVYINGKPRTGTHGKRVEFDRD